MSNELNIKVAKLALTKHYDEFTAAEKIQDTYNRIRERALEAQPEVEQDPKFEDLLTQDVVALAINMMWEPEPWWDSEDPTTLAVNQLERESLFLSVDQLVEATEKALGRSLGDSKEEKWQNLGNDRFKILAELKGEEYEAPPQDMLAQLLGMIQGQNGEGSELPEDYGELEGELVYDDFGAPTDPTQIDDEAFDKTLKD